MPETAVKSRAILFSGPMVRAILAGKKTQTRRVLKYRETVPAGWYPDRYNKTADWTFWGPRGTPESGKCTLPLFRCPYGEPGDSLWVRETFVYRSKHDRYYYRADHLDPFTEPYAHGGWKPSIFMPRSASRISLDILEMRVQRLKEITEEDAIAEGVDCVSQDDVRRQATWSRRQDFAGLWDRINKKRGFGWETNPWVWALTFKRCEVKA